MKNKAWKKLLAAVLTVCMIISVLPVSTLAVTSVTPEPAQGDAGELQVEYFPTTFIDYDQVKANQAAQAADIKQGTTTTQWVPVDPSWYSLTSSVVEHKNTGYYVLVDGEYYPAYISMTRVTTSYIYRTDSYALTYLKDGQYIEDDNYKAEYYIISGSPAGNNYPGGLYERKETTTAAEQQGRGFYFATDADGKPTDTKYIPLFSKGWGQNKTNGPAIPGGQTDGKNDPNNSGQDQDFYIYSGLAARKLSESTNAPFANDVNAAPGFFSTDPTVGTDYRTVYTNVGVPYVYDEKTGNYTLDSDKNGVYFKGGIAESNTNMMIADLPSAIRLNGESGGKLLTSLAPFVDATEKVVRAAPSGRDSVGGTNTETVNAYQMNFSDNKAEAKEKLYAFGMVTEFKFQMTDDGMSPVNGEPINFHFSGDDDVWVYIDGVLALDIGGVHDAIQGNINFATGEVTVSAPDSRIGKVGDRATNQTMDNQYAVESLGQGNIYEKLGTTLTGFAAQGQHTLTIYYMERGEGKVNCMIQFNLPQRDTIEVTKKFDNTKDDEGKITPISSDVLENYGSREFGFTLYKDNEAVANKTYYVYDENDNLIATRSTNAYGHFVLKRNETARFLVNIGENETYQVVEDDEQTNGFVSPDWTCTTNIAETSVTENENGFNGMIVTATGSDTVADTISFVCENYLSLNTSEVSIIPQGERIVIDYGLPITIKVSELLKNDIITGDKITVKLISDGGKFGTAEYDDKKTDDVLDDTITYTLNKQLTGIETLTYSITVSGESNVGSETVTKTDTATADIQIMPATSMYYEENFGTRKEVDGPTLGSTDIQYGLVKYSDGNVKWESVGNSLTENQETGFVGTSGDSTYGSDAVYLKNLGDSYGTSMKVITSSDFGARFEYDFTGTGTAIYGRISPKTGYIQVTVTDSDGDIADLQYIDTTVLANVGTTEELYNVPIYLNTYLSHGNYHVRVYIYPEGTPTNNSSYDENGVLKGGSGAEFYLDGIRIYNPILDNDTVNTAYADDGEANTAVINIRDKVFQDEDAESVFTLTDKYGNVIETELDNGNADYDRYADYGPNHEFYLNNGKEDATAYTVSFKLVNWESGLYKLYLGMKTPAGKESKVMVGSQEIEINNSADCYYDISNYVYVTSETVDGESYQIGTVTITGVEGLVSLTNIKVTGTEAFILGDSSDIEAGGDDIYPDDPGDEEIVYSARKLYMVPATFSLTPEEEEIPVFEPEKLDVSCTYRKLLRTAVVTVQTGKDVKTLTVNGVEVRPIRLWNTNVFIYTATRVPSGTALEVVAYNADGVASEPTTVIAQ